jgi:hypothetical protein
MVGISGWRGSEFEFKILSLLSTESNANWRNNLKYANSPSFHNDHSKPYAINFVSLDNSRSVLINKEGDMGTEFLI